MKVTHEQLQADVERDLRRGERWGRAYVAFTAIVGVLVTVAWVVFLMVREERLWTR